MADGKSDLFKRGMATRRKVLGDAYVDKAQAASSPIDEAFQDLITETAWGRVWSGDQFTKRERSLVTLALLAGLGNDEEFKLHVKACRNTGTSEADIAEVLQHVAIYAGVPRANQALKLTKSSLKEKEEQ